MIGRKLPPTYTRLCRHRTGSLWLAPDHLLVVSSSLLAEDYRRVALGDVQAIFIYSDGRRLLWALAWGALLVFSGVFVINGFHSVGGPRISLVFLAIGAAGLIWNLLRGPGCCGYLVTRVQTLRLPGFRRRPRGRRVLGRLGEAIARAQAAASAVPTGGPSA
jgi:hypothetical protein